MTIGRAGGEAGATGAVRVKICCLQSVEELRLAVAEGAAAVGFVSWMPSGFGPLPEERIAELAKRVPLGVTSVLLTCAQEAEAIVAQQRRTGVGAIQLCDRLQRTTGGRAPAGGPYAVLRRELPGVRLLQAIHVTGEGAVSEALAVAPHVDAILLDSGNPALAVKELGGTGRVHDWRLSRQIREEAGIPVFLAGGLGPDNVARAIAEVRPFGVDVCTGLRVDGRLDPLLLRSFFEQVRAVGG